MRDRFYLRGVIIFITSFFTAGILSCCSYSQKNEISVLTIVPTETSFFTRTSTLNPTETPVPKQTIAPTLTATPAPLVFTDHSGQMEPYPDLEVITAGNVHRLEEVDVWGQGTVMGIALTPDGSTIAVSTATGVYFYDAKTLKQTDFFDYSVVQIDYALMRCYDTYDNLDYSPDGKSLLIGFDELYVLDLETRGLNRFETTETEMENFYVMEATYSKDGKHILINRALPQGYGYQMLFEIYEVSSAKPVFQYDFKQYDSSSRIYLIDDHYAAFAQILVDVDSGKIIQEEAYFIPAIEEQSIVSEPLSDDQWRVSLPQENITCDFSGQVFLKGMTDFSEDHLTLITLDDSTAGLNILHFDSCQKSEQFLFFPDTFGKFRISPKGNYVISGSFFGEYRSLWDVYTGEVFPFVETDGLIFDKYDSQLFSINQSLSRDEKTLRTVIKNVVSGETLFQMEEGPYTEFIMNPANSGIFFLNDYLINLSQEFPVVKQYDKYLYQFTPDGNYVAYLEKQIINGDALLYFDSVIDGTLIESETIIIPILAPPGLENVRIEEFQMSTSGRYVVLFQEDEFLVWDIHNQKSLAINDEIKNEFILILEFFPDDQLLLYREAPYVEGKLKFWDVRTEQVVYEFIPSRNLSLGPLISPDGKFLAFLGYDGTIRIYGVRNANP